MDSMVRFTIALGSGELRSSTRDVMGTTTVFHPARFDDRLGDMDSTKDSQDPQSMGRNRITMNNELARTILCLSSDLAPFIPCQFSLLQRFKYNQRYMRFDNMITLEEAKNLRHGQTLYHVKNTNANGSPQKWRVNGKPKTWIRSPERVEVPVKHGLKDFDTLTENELHLVCLNEVDATMKGNMRR